VQAAVAHLASNCSATLGKGKGTPVRLHVSAEGMHMVSKVSGDVVLTLPISRVITLWRSAVILTEHHDPAISTVVCHRVEYNHAAHHSSVANALGRAFAASFAAEQQHVQAPPAPPTATLARGKFAAVEPASASAPRPDLEEFAGLDGALIINRRMLADADELLCHSAC